MTTLRFGDTIVARMTGVAETKNRPAVVLSSEVYHSSRPDSIVGFVTSNSAVAITPSDHELQDWHDAGLRKRSVFRSFIVTLPALDCKLIGHLSEKDRLPLK